MSGPAVSGTCFLLPVRQWTGMSAWTVGRAGGDRHLAMYTFMVGPWLSTSCSTISAGLTHTPGRMDTSEIEPHTQNQAEYSFSPLYNLQIHLMRWLPLCLLLRSSTLQRSPQFLCNCELKPPSAQKGTTMIRWGLFRTLPWMCSSFSYYLCVPDVHAFIKGAAGQMAPVGTESHTVHWLLVFGQSVDANASVHIPKTNRGVKRCAAEAARTLKQLFYTTK